MASKMWMEPMQQNLRQQPQAGVKDGRYAS